MKTNTPKYFFTDYSPIKGLGSSKTKNLYYLIKLYENFRVFGYNDDN